jgi:hypothetical protein
MEIRGFFAMVGVCSLGLSEFAFSYKTTTFEMMICFYRHICFIKSVHSNSPDVLKSIIFILIFVRCIKFATSASRRW